MDIKNLLLKSIYIELPDKSPFYQHKEGQRVSGDNEILNRIVAMHFSQYDEKFAFPVNKSKMKVLELCCGTGINSIMLSKCFSRWNFKGIDIDKEQIFLAKYNAQIQNLSVDFTCRDLRTYISPEKYDIVIVNPPFFKKDSGRMTASYRTNISKWEIECNLSDVINAIDHNLSDTGQGWIIYSKQRSLELFQELRNKDFSYKIEYENKKIIIVGFNRC